MKPKRAIAFGGGGPALGYDVGALAKFAESGIEFDVWSLSCSGGWIGVIYNSFDGTLIERARSTRDFLRSVFRDSATYAHFPVAKIFAPQPNVEALTAYFADPKNLDDLVVPTDVIEAYMRETMAVMVDPSRWNGIEFGRLFFEAAAVDPMMRHMFSSFWRSNVTGLSQLTNADWLGKIKFDNLYRENAPTIYHNVWNLARQRVEMFSNKDAAGCGKISARSVCACSSLPFLQSPVVVDADPLCEAVMHPMNFDRVFEHQIDEIWIVHGLHVGLAKPPRNLTDSFGNLIMLLSATCGANSISLFRNQAQETRWGGRIIELPTSDNITLDWTHENFDASYAAGHAAATQALETS